MMMMMSQATWIISENDKYDKYMTKEEEEEERGVEGGIESVHDIHSQQQQQQGSGSNNNNVLLRGLQASSTAVNGVNVVYTVTAPQTSFTPATMFTALNTAIR